MIIANWTTTIRIETYNHHLTASSNHLFAECTVRSLWTAPVPALLPCPGSRCRCWPHDRDGDLHGECHHHVTCHCHAMSGNSDGRHPPGQGIPVRGPPARRPRQEEPLRQVRGSRRIWLREIRGAQSHSHSQVICQRIQYNSVSSQCNAQRPGYRILD